MSNKHKKRDREQKPTPTVNPQIKRGVVVIFLFVLAILSVLSFLNLAGIVGTFFEDLLSWLFGVLRYVVPVILIWLAVMIMRHHKESEHRPTYIIGFILLALTLSGLIHLRLPLEQNISAALQGESGGLVGVALSYPLLFLMGFWGAITILGALLIVSLILISSASISKLMELARGVRGKLAALRPIKVHGAYEDTRGFESREIDPDADEDAKEEKNVGAEEEETEDESEEPLDDEIEEEDKEKLIDGKQMPLPKPKVKRHWRLPGIELLITSKSKPTAGDVKANSQLIHDTLSQFGIEVDMGEIRVGPTVTQYALKPSRGVKLSRITALHNDLALALAAHPIRIEAPIPGKPYVGIEVPNQRVALVTLRELLESDEFKNRETGMSIALGKDVAGKVWFADLPRMPHLLIAGATGSGKTVCINTIILSLLYQNTPEQLRFIMVDPKRVELPLYNGIPHLLTPVITDVPRTVNALKWTIGEMDRRFELLAKAGRRDVGSYNRIADDPLPYLVFVIDELADLMATSAAEVEAGIIRLAQMARAVGIHLVVATQRPSVDVITGLMKANIPTRIAFSVASIIDSRTILDASGAEKLLGRGDMLFSTAELSKPRRLQGAFVSEEEMKRVVEFLKTDDAPEYNEAVVEVQFGASTSVFGPAAHNDRDPLFEEAKKVVIESGKASTSLLQRRLKLGYARAARIIDELEAVGVVGKGEGAKPREILALKGQNGMMTPGGVSPEELANDGAADLAYAEASGDEIEDDGVPEDIEFQKN
ncbi:MAG: putative cell division FtsK/SpoIIIE [Candidatus Magasanikbacteria bacterium]|nr:putative cell division FtsK/SpoIIIE [Candidatus Magasanikbacteria bacterium]